MLALVAALFSGCSSNKGKEEVLKEMGSEEEVTIKVMYWDESYFNMKYGNLFTSKFPNINIEVVSALSVMADPSIDQKEALRKFIDEQQPDVLLLDASEFAEFAQNGELYELSGVIRQDQFDLDGMLPAVIDLLKDKGSGNLYGLAPSFYSLALYYNADLFQEHGVELPRNGMTWEEVFKLAEAFPQEENDENRIYGFYISPSYFNLINSVGATYGSMFVNPEEELVTFDSESWKQSYELAINALKSGSIHINDQSQIMSGSIEDIFKNEKFTVGKAAMTINAPVEMLMMSQASSFMKDYKPFNWGVVTMPIDPTDPTTTVGMSLNEIFAINAKSNHLRAAWEFVKYVNSAEMAKIQAQTMDGSLPTRTEFIKDKENHDLSAFYALKPKFDYLETYGQVPSSFIQRFAGIVDKETKAVLENNKSIEDAIRDIQEQGQSSYLDALEEQKKEKENK